MTWQWVVLITGVIAEIVLLFAYVAWTNMRVKMFEAIPRTIPDFMMSKAKSEADEDTIVAAETLPKWPQEFTGDEEERKS